MRPGIVKVLEYFFEINELYSKGLTDDDIIGYINFYYTDIATDFSN